MAKNKDEKTIEGSATVVAVSGVSAKGKVAKGSRNPVGGPKVAKALAADIKIAGITMAEFAKEIGVPVTTVSSWMAEESIPAKHIMKIVQYFGPHSRTYVRARGQVSERIKENDSLKKRSGGIALDLFKDLAAYASLNRWVEENMEGKSLDEGIKQFKIDVPEHADITERDWFKKNKFRPGGISSVKVAGSGAVRVAKEALGLGTARLNEGHVLLHTPPNEDLRFIRDHVSKFLSPFRRVDQEENPFQIIKPGVNSYSAEYIVGIAPVSYREDREENPKTKEKKKHIAEASIKSVAFDLMAEKMNDQLDRPVIYLIYDKFKLIKERQLYEAKRGQSLLEHRDEFMKKAMADMKSKGHTEKEIEQMIKTLDQATQSMGEMQTIYHTLESFKKMGLHVCIVSDTDDTLDALEQAHARIQHERNVIDDEDRMDQFYG